MNWYSKTTLHLILLAFLLAACTATPPGPAPTQTATSGVPTVPPSPTVAITSTPTTPAPQIALEPTQLQGQTIRFWHAFNGAPAHELKTLTDEFNASNEWGLTVETTAYSSYDDLAAAVDQAMEQGQLPELVSVYPYQALEWAGKTALVDLDPYQQDARYGLTPEERADFVPAWVEATPRLGLPFLQSAQVLLYNLAWAKELGFNAPPATPKEFRDQVCAAAAALREDDISENDGTGGWIITTHYAAVLSWIESFGAQPAGDTAGYRFDSDASQAAFTFQRELLDSGCAWLGRDLDPDSEFASRQGLIAVTSVAAIPDQKTAFTRQKNSDEWTVLPYPSPIEQSSLTVYGPALTVFQTADEADLAAWLFARWLISPAAQVRLVEASSMLPVRAAALDGLEAYRSQYPQWAAAAQALPLARPEPSIRSWSTVRWAVEDAATQLFRYYFTIDQVPSLLKLLDETANDLHERSLQP